ncbi:MAG: hypothetical protein AVDCRST_MAG49-210, partial [uncultured Thermomicrobiales bacterium]
WWSGSAPAASPVRGGHRGQGIRRGAGPSRPRNRRRSPRRSPISRTTPRAAGRGVADRRPPTVGFLDRARICPRPAAGH